MAQLSAQKKKEYREAFDLFDKDKSGTITVQELSTVMKSLGMSPNWQVTLLRSTTMEAERLNFLNSAP